MTFEPSGVTQVAALNFGEEKRKWKRQKDHRSWHRFHFTSEHVDVMFQYAFIYGEKIALEKQLLLTLRFSNSVKKQWQNILLFKV